MDEREWLKRHLSLLMNMGKAIRAMNGATGADERVAYEKGPWTALKLICLEYYIPAYIDIMRRTFPRIAYVDMFAGPGMNLIGSNLTPMPGSPMIPLMHRGNRRYFDFQIASDSSPSRAQALRSRLGSWRCEAGAGLKDGEDFVVLNQDANELALELPERLRAKDVNHALVFVDPEGFDLEWSSLKAMTDGFPHMDLILLFPSTGVPRVLGLDDGPGLDKLRRMIGPGADGLAQGCTEEQALDLYRRNLTSIGKDLSTEIKIAGKGGFHYHLIPAVRRTAHGSPWFKVLEDAKSKVERLGPDFVQLAMDQIEGRMGQLDV